MISANLESVAQQIDGLDPEEKWTLLALLIERLREQAEPTRRLCDYYGLGKNRGFQTAQEVDTFIQEERTSWET